MIFAHAAHRQDGAFHEDIGYGQGKGSSRPQGEDLFSFIFSNMTVIDKAKKQASTDALKRALKWGSHVVRIDLAECLGTPSANALATSNIFQR